MHPSQTSTDAAIIRASRRGAGAGVMSSRPTSASMSGGTAGRPDSVDVTYRVTRVTAPSLDPAH